MNAFDELKWFGLVVVGIWILWFLSGGAARYEKESGILLKPPGPLSTGETYGKPPEIKLKIPETINVSILGGEAAIGAKNDLRATNPQKEYFEIVNKSDQPIDITGLKLIGRKGVSATIPGAARAFKSGELNQTSDIYLAQGEKAIVVSGVSPVGVSFRVNSCSGYLSQFQDFYPSLSNACPLISEESLVKKYSPDAACLDYIKQLPVCETTVKSLPKDLSPACHQFILEHASYNACVSDNSGNAGFYGNEWRVYFGKSEELWGDHDSIKMYDSAGGLVGTYAY